MRREDRSYQRSRQTSRRGTRNTTRGARGGRGKRYEQQSSGAGWVMMGLIGLALIGTYFMTGEEGKAYVDNLLQKIALAPKEEAPEVADTMQSIVETTPCTQGNIAKIMVYTLFEEKDIPQAKPGEPWYSKYYQMLQGDERFKFFDEANAMMPITYNETLVVLKSVLGESYNVSLEMDAELGAEYISLKEFLVAYEQALTHSGLTHTLREETLSVLATQSTHEDLGSWEVATSEGLYGFEGIILDPFKDYTLEVLVQGTEILGIIDTVSSESIVEECFISKVEGDQATVQVGDLEIKYQSTVLKPEDAGSTGKITIKNSQIIDYELQLDEDADTVVKVTDSYIEFKKGGCIPYEKVVVYNAAEDGNYSSINQLFSGLKASYTVDGGKVTTLKVVDDKASDAMRVVLTSDGMGNYVHEDVVLVSDVDCDMTYGEQKLKLKAGTPWSVSGFSWEIPNEKLVVTPENDETITIQTMTRHGINPEYLGELEIYKEKEGYTVVNELDIEDYVACVIPSEMPTSYGLEAAKVQAVAARSYAKGHQKSSQFAKYGAQVDDTVTTQVYNNVASDETSIKAAEATKGEVLTHNGRIISGNFFATSCGYTANYGETWATGEIFPTNTPVYLMSKQQYLGDRIAEDLSNEKDAYTFLTKSPEEVDAFDNHSPWFRWTVDFSAAELDHVINSNVYRLTTQYPNMVKVYDEESKKWAVGELDNIGKIKDMQIKSRGSGGNVMEMQVVGEEASIKVSTEYLVRILLSPIQKDSSKDSIDIVRGDGSKVSNMAMLPSAFFTMDLSYEEEVISKATLYGGGFGHGVGMSQDGVKGMVDRGYDYKEILRHYYSEVEIDKV